MDWLAGDHLREDGWLRTDRRIGETNYSSCFIEVILTAL